MRDKTLFPEEQAGFQGLEKLHQKGMEVRAFAQRFWTGAERLDVQDMDLKDIFNLCLDESLPHWEMELVKSLDFWNFSRYLQLRKEGKSSPGSFIDSHAQAEVKKEGSKDSGGLKSGGPGGPVSGGPRSGGPGGPYSGGPKSGGPGGHYSGGPKSGGLGGPDSGGPRSF
ncbi:glycine-rich RNA-binding protein 1-like [Sinocyclocheilus rhinocerous]|uniref:glycine-rich RNA-binding protein 1-like n=1 Tax=Sinocyclocheilus rhinocerous TaxID=307959 RepID=UPI0007B9BF56|nr:PREDICTED: glycine-rich RNA-binding protein 1-like [Sinocyclocheilus rhinocerous]